MSTTTIETVVAWTSAVTPHGDIHRGERYRVEDPRVVGWRDFFVHPDLPREEWPNELALLEQARAENEAERLRLEREQFEADAKANPIRLDVGEIVRCTADHPASLHGRPVTVRKGSTCLASDEITRQQPELWKAV